MKPDPISANCRKDYKAVFHGPRRATGKVVHIVIHGTEGGTAESNARFFAGLTQQKPKGSAHAIMDQFRCYRVLEDNQTAYAAPGANTQGFHLELVGFAKWTITQWMAKRATIERAAYKTAYHCHRFKIPPVWVKAEGLKAGRKGVTSHAECSKAFGGDHTDPGFGFPRRYFMQRVKFHYLRMHG